MFFNFTIRHFLINPKHLAQQLQTSSMRGFGRKVVLVFLTGILLFSIRNWWGMGTEAISPLITTMSTTDYTLARYASLFGSFCWSLIYMSFHFFGIAYILSLLTSIPFKKLLPLQLLVTSLLLIEKALVFVVFVMKGATVNMSFLSFGPLAATFLENTYLIFFLNQLTLTTALIIALQYSFIRSFTDLMDNKRILWILIGIHIAMALITAAIGFIPVEILFEKVTGGVVVE